jgi:hypothetical protein
MNDTALGTEITATAARIRALLDLDASGTPGDLLPELAILDEAERNLRVVRDSVLVHVRRRGSSWNTIEASTDVPATTWRGRYVRHTEETSRP